MEISVAVEGDTGNVIKHNSCVTTVLAGKIDRRNDTEDKENVLG